MGTMQDFQQPQPQPEPQAQSDNKGFKIFLASLLGGAILVAGLVHAGTDTEENAEPVAQEQQEERPAPFMPHEGSEPEQDEEEEEPQRDPGDVAALAFDMFWDDLSFDEKYEYCHVQGTMGASNMVDVIMDAVESVPPEHEDEVRRVLEIKSEMACE